MLNSQKNDLLIYFIICQLYAADDFDQETRSRLIMIVENTLRNYGNKNIIEIIESDQYRDVMERRNEALKNNDEMNFDLKEEVRRLGLFITHSVKILESFSRQFKKNKVKELQSEFTNMVLENIGSISNAAISMNENLSDFIDCQSELDLEGIIDDMRKENLNEI